MIKCANCGNESPDDALFCDQCGARLKPAAKEARTTQAVPPASEPVAPPKEPAGRCPDCGAMNTPGEMYCGECGAPLEAPEPEKDAQISAEPRALSTSVTSPGASTCPFCGTELTPGETFCPACGAEVGQPLLTPAATPATSPQPAPSATAHEPAAPTPAKAPAPPQDAAPSECPACGAQVNAEDTFCEFCGAALVGAGAAAQPAAPAQPQTAPTPAVIPPSTARLVLSSSGIEIPLPPSDQAVVGREDPYAGVYPDVDLTPHGGEEGGVSRRHFRITRSGRGYTLEDLNSTNLTYLNRNKVEPGTPVRLTDGDEIRAGRIKMVFKEP